MNAGPPSYRDAPRLEAPPWLLCALGEYGVREVPGRADNPRIREYHACAAGESPDAVPWCSSFVNWCFNRADYSGTASKRARSWLDWGARLEEPTIGCVCVLWRESFDSGKGHVGFWIATRAGRVWLLGGNQGNEVNVRPYPLKRVLGYRWPN